MAVSRQLKIKYHVEPDAATLALRVAQYFVQMTGEAVEARGRARIALSGGSTPRAVFELLATPPWSQRVPWSLLDVYWVDERCVPPDAPASNYRMSREALFDHVPLPARQIHRIEGELEPEMAANRYESELRANFGLRDGEFPRFDLVVLGIGEDGHTASLFPHSAALHETRRLAAANHAPQPEAWRVTLTWPVINSARAVFFLVTGREKASVLKEVFTGSYEPERLPAQLIGPPGGILTLFLDKAAAALLPATDEAGCGVLERKR